MNKIKTINGLLTCIIVALAGVFAACSNSDYDFNEVDFTLGLGSDELNLPTSGTRDMHIDDFLGLEEGDCVQIMDNGDYAFLQYGSDVEPARPFIERPVFTFSALAKEYLLDDELKKNLPNIKVLGGGSKPQAKVSNPLEIKEEEIATFEWKTEQENIVSLVNAGVESVLVLHTSFSENLTKCIDAFISMEWVLPDFMEVDVEKTQTDKGVMPSFDESTNRLILNNVRTNEDLTLYIYLCGLNFENTPEGRIYTDEGKLTIAGTIYLTVQAGYEITEENKDYTTDCKIISELESDGIVIAYSTGQFDPDIDLGDIGDINVSNVPDFLKEDGVYIDLYNPMVLLEIDNNMDVAAEQISAVLTSTKDAKSVDIDVPGVRIRSYNADYIERAKQNNQTVTNEKDKLPEEHRTTKILACESRERFDKETLRAYEEDSLYEILEVPELQKILIDGRIPDKLKFVLDVTVDKSRTSSIELGNETYYVKPRYKILIPIAFGENAVIAYTDSIDNLQEDLDGLDFTEGAYLELTADVYSRLPMHLDTKVLPLTKDGRNLEDIKEVTVEVDEDIPGTDDENIPAKGRLRIKIGGDIKQLDKLKFTLKGSASDESSKSIVGITLNEYKHSIQLTNVNMKLKGKLVYDAN